MNSLLCFVKKLLLRFGPKLWYLGRGPEQNVSYRWTDRPRCGGDFSRWKLRVFHGGFFWVKKALRNTNKSCVAFILILLFHNTLTNDSILITSCSFLLATRDALTNFHHSSRLHYSLSSCLCLTSSSSVRLQPTNPSHWNKTTYLTSTHRHILLPYNDQSFFYTPAYLALTRQPGTVRHTEPSCSHAPTRLTPAYWSVILSYTSPSYLYKRIHLPVT